MDNQLPTERDLEDVPPRVHTHHIPLRAQLVVTILAVTIFGAGVVFGIEWTKATEDTVSTSTSGVTPRAVSPRTQAEPAVDGEATTSQKAEPTDTRPVLVMGDLSGYYTTRDMDAWGTVTTCDAFVVTEGSESLLDAYRSLMQGGNIPQAYDTEGRLIIDLPWDRISKADQKTIRASTAKNSITITMREQPPGNKGAEVCQSYLSFVGIPEN